MAENSVRKAFVRRFNEACDASGVVPPLQQGRLVFLHEELGVSQEAVRKWFAGITMPTRETMSKLAKLLRVDEVWLAMGRKVEMDRRDTTEFARGVHGAALVVAGMIQMGGGTCAWPGEDDPRRGTVDFYTIYKGRQYSIRVCMAREESPDAFEIEAPADIENLTLIGVVPAGRKGRYDFLLLPTAQVAAQKNRRTGGYTIPVARAADGYKTGKILWPQIRNFAELSL